LILQFFDKGGKVIEVELTESRRAISSGFCKAVTILKMKNAAHKFIGVK